MNQSNTTLIFGPPGTGKTHDLLRITEGLFSEGLPPDQLMFIAFTRKAAHEAKHRAMEKFQLHGDNLPWFRTLHSLAFHQLALDRSKVLGVGDYLNLAKELGIFITANRGMSEDGTLSGLTKGDRLFFMENMSRAQCVGLRDYWSQHPDEDVYFYELERLQNTLIAYKKETDKLDFTDIINVFLTEGNVPNAKVMIVDEAQDLTPLQWNMVRKLGENIEQVYIAGDDDQAIFRWAGADVDQFMQIPGSRRVLDQSYRVPSLVQNLATRIAGRIEKRIPKVWDARAAEGQLEFVNAVEHIDMSSGTWLLLARNSYLLEPYNAHCTREGYVFDSSLGSPVKGSSFRAIKSWEELRKGKPVRADDVRKIYDLMSTKVGVAYGFKTKLDRVPDNKTLTMAELSEEYGLTTDRIWHEALDKLGPAEVEYFLAALRRGEKLLREPRIKISTIHAIKGGEADNVVVCLDMADRTYKEYQERPDDEHRVFYVAVTRARERLFILMPQTTRSYDI